MPKACRGKSIDGAAMQRLKAHRWPGNVRELENLVRRLCALYSQEMIGLDAIESELAEAAPAPAMNEAPARRPGRRRPSGICANISPRITTACRPAGVYDRVVREIERPLIALSLGGDARQPAARRRSCSGSTATRCARKSANWTSTWRGT